MASPLIFKVYKNNELVASFRNIRDCANMVSQINPTNNKVVVKGDGAILWNSALKDTVGQHLSSFVAEIMNDRHRKHVTKRYSNIEEVPVTATPIAVLSGE